MVLAVKIKKKKKPKFNVLNYGFIKSVKPRWRRPRGTHNKKRMKFKWAGASPKIGYKNSTNIRGLHPSGLKEVLVNTTSELTGLKGKEVVVRIASKVGLKKRILIEDMAKSMNLVVLNPHQRFDESGAKESKDNDDKVVKVAESNKSEGY